MHSPTRGDQVHGHENGRHTYHRPPQYPEEVTLYANLWAGLTRGITIPETFVHIFQVVRCLIDHSYYHNMALGYVIFQCITAANTHHLSRDALHGLLVTLAVF
jgi:hypothetical protein